MVLSNYLWLICQASYQICKAYARHTNFLYFYFITFVVDYLVMRLRAYLLLWVLSFFSGSLSVWAATAHSISRREGLSNGAVNAIVSDVEGYIWLGTWNGLNRYDGQSIETFLPASSHGTIHNHVVREIYPAKNGLMWMLTNRGIALYEHKNGQFSSFFADESEQINYENDIALTYSKELGALALVFGQGLFRFDSVSDQFVSLEINTASKAEELTLQRIHLANDKLYGISSKGTVFSYQDGDLIPVLQLPLTGTLTATSIQVIAGIPYFLITQRNGPAFVVDLAQAELQVLELTDDLITSMAASRMTGMLWIGSEKGRIFSYDLTTGDFTEQQTVSKLYSDNPIATRILCLYETEPDLLWVGTDGNGAYIMKLTEFPVIRLESEKFSYPIVRSILVTVKGDILVGTKGGGIDVFDSEGTHIRQISSKDGLSNNSVLSFYERADGTIWVGTDGNGVDILSPDYLTIKSYPYDFFDKIPLHFSSVYRIMEDVDGDIYLGTSGYGVVRIKTDVKGKPLDYAQLMLDKRAATNLQKQIVYALTNEKPGIIWIGTRGFGVYRYNTVSQRVTAHYMSGSHPELIGNDDVLSLFTDTEGMVWVGSSGGLFGLKPKEDDSHQIKALVVQDGLPSNSIHTITEDQSANLWITTNYGLSLIDSTRRIIQSFNTNDGLINFEYSDGASYFDALGNRLFVGGTMGMDIVQTDAIRFSSYFPPLAINSLLIRNIAIKPGEGKVLQQRANLQTNFKLRYAENSFAFIAKPLAYWGRERYRLSYRLLNYHTEWTTLPLDQPVAFSNMEAGNYILQFRVSDENGIWSDIVREITITVKPPFWRTAWAIAGYIVFFLLIQLLIILAYRRREARRKEALLIEMQMKQEKEMQAYKLEFFTNVAHEFRTPLTLISSYIHELMDDKKLISENSRLTRVYNNSLKLQKLILEIMQFRKLEKGKEPLTIQEANICQLIKEVVSDFELLASQRQIYCTTEGCEQPLLFKTDADKFQRIVTNLVSNAIKYNVDDGKVTVRLMQQNRQLVVEVIDIGIGIEPVLLPKLFEPFGVSSTKKRASFPGYRSSGLGLAVTKGLVELLGGTIDVDSKPGYGTTFRCVFPDVHSITVSADSAMVREESLDYLIETEEVSMSPADQLSGEDRPLLLITDDDPEILNLLKEFLERHYNLVFAANGMEAYEKTLTHKPALIISDVMMPIMDGIELCKRLRDNFDTSHLPLILLTAKSEIEDRIMGLQAGADAYIPKPFHPDHLRIRIEKLLELRKQIQLYFRNQADDINLVDELPDPFFQKMLEFIDENIDDTTLSADRLCQQLAVSRSSLYDKTKTILATTPHGLINQRRLGKAAVLLETTQMTVSEIIDQTGFSSRTNFYELFNKSYSCTPSEYRMKRKQQANHN
jgi:signal transduction histidine kinase/DNA-binding response OmpR family regulator/ligand-binding sensor domain-containing protein